MVLVIPASGICHTLTVQSSEAEAVNRKSLKGSLNTGDHTNNIVVVVAPGDVKNRTLVPCHKGVVGSYSASLKKHTYEVQQRLRPGHLPYYVVKQERPHLHRTLRSRQRILG